MLQPCFEMENGHNAVMNTTLDENDPEVMARRIKNRERQRRYRARKRQEADLKRTQVGQTHVNDTPPLTHVYAQQVDHTQVNATLLSHVYSQQTQVSDTPVNVETRVYSPRNWKKEARRAHLLKQQQEDVANSTCASMDLQLSESQLTVGVDTREHSVTPSGRNWKAEARNKRN